MAQMKIMSTHFTAKPVTLYCTPSRDRERIWMDIEHDDGVILEVAFPTEDIVQLAKAFSK